MTGLAGIAILIFLPIQFYFAGFFSELPKKQDVQIEKVEGAADDKTQKTGNSFRASVDSSVRSETALNELGYIPQRNKNYSETKVFAGSAVVVDVDSGTILYYDKGRDHVPIASLTKTMTAVVVMENVKNLDDPVTVDLEAVSAPAAKVGCPSSNLAECYGEKLQVGEKISVKNLLTAMLIDSANDAAIALGKYVAGTQKNFAEMMNEKAKQLNLADSNFCNPTGLDEEGCYSSAYDLARIAAYSMKYDMVWKIMRTQDSSVSSVDGTHTHLLRNTDELLGQIPNSIGGKTGFTYNAGKSLMFAAIDPQTQSHKIIAVILNDDNRWEDMKNLVDWTFKSYDWR
jgi:D-alanyl-D-alanine carboxypeptidase (penicillin-binding protein 5/6)